MTTEKILENNKFKNCSTEELQTLWLGLKQFYSDGWCSETNPITPYKNLYCAESPIGVVQVEQDLLRAIACKCFG
mgnify:CR=1 FL=1